MSQQKWYRGSKHFVICQVADGIGHLCRRPTRFTGVGRVENKTSRLYECESGHRFALSAAHGDTIGGVSGELDVSGETANSHTAIVSGESRTSRPGEPDWLIVREALLDPFYTDRRRVVVLPTGRPVFGRQQ